MKIIKCGCSRLIHIYDIDSGKCPFCGNTVDVANAIDYSFCGKLDFLNKEISKIDQCASSNDFTAALRLIDDVLEWMPGWEIGDKVPRTGEIYWRKLLAGNGCKNDVELLYNKRKHLRDYPAFNNAVKYANDNERPVYELIEKIEETLEKLLVSALEKNEFNAKRETGAGKKSVEYKEELEELRASVLKNITRLEAKEKEIHEQAIDCENVAGEHKYALGELSTKANNVFNRNRNDITKEEKDAWEKELEIILKESSLEYDELQHTFSSHPKFTDYNRLVNEHKAICDQVYKNILDLRGFNKKTEQFTASIDKIIIEHAEAREGVGNGNYSRAKVLLTPERFEKIVKLALSEVKGRV